MGSFRHGRYRTNVRPKLIPVGWMKFAPLGLVLGCVGKLPSCDVWRTCDGKEVHTGNVFPFAKYLLSCSTHSKPKVIASHTFAKFVFKAFGVCGARRGLTLAVNPFVFI